MSTVSPAGSPNAHAGRRSVHCYPSGQSPLLLGAGFPRSPPSRVHRHRGAHTRTPGPATRLQPLAHLAGAPPDSGARIRSRCPCPLEPALPPLGAGSPEAPSTQLRETGREPGRQKQYGWDTAGPECGEPWGMLRAAHQGTAPDGSS
ncbi:hypothetical protein NN561_004094 [Cricetulus griseus]